MQVTFDYILSELKEEQFIADLLLFLSLSWKLLLKVSYVVSLLLWLIGSNLWILTKSVLSSFSYYVRDVKMKIYLVSKEGESKWSKGLANWLYLDVVKDQNYADYKVQLLINKNPTSVESEMGT